MKKTRGFTLVEALIVVSILGILAALALPNFSGTIQQTKARKTADYVAQMVNLARNEALNKNKDVYLTLVNGSLCLSQPATPTGAKTCNLRQDAVVTGAVVSITNSGVAGEIKFDGIYGAPDTPAQLLVSTPNATRTVSVNVMGIVTVTGG